MYVAALGVSLAVADLALPPSTDVKEIPQILQRHDPFPYGRGTNTHAKTHTSSHTGTHVINFIENDEYVFHF